MIFLRDLSREVEFDHRLNKYMKNHDNHQPGRDFEFKLKLWNDLFRFMPNDAGGIMSHINGRMAQEHASLLHRQSKASQNLQ